MITFAFLNCLDNGGQIKHRHDYKIPLFLQICDHVCSLCRITLFDQNNLIKQAQAKREISHLEKEINFYHDAIKNDQSKIKAINSSLENLETFAREEYLMKRENEEIFIIKE